MPAPAIVPPVRERIAGSSAYASADLGVELACFDHAGKWKSYWADFAESSVRGDVLEVGAGSGGSTSLLADRATEWLCLEPDPVLAARLQQKIASGDLPPHCRIARSTLTDLPGDRLFDTLLYIDVLEHIEDHAAEMRLAAARLRPGGSLVVLVPAYQFLFSPFDRAIGHYRRYTRKTLCAVIPAPLEAAELRYLDSLGMLLLLGNRFALRSARSHPGAVRFWNDWLIPFSRAIDPLLLYGAGKALLGIWRKRSV